MQFLVASSTPVPTPTATTTTALPSSTPPISQPIMRCDSCLKEFENLTSFRRHKNHCRHLLYSAMIADDGNSPVILRPPPNLEETRQLLESTLCPTDIVYLCQLQSWCLKGYYPLVFPGKGGGSPVLRDYSCGEKSSDILKEYLKDKRTMTLPKNIIIRDESNGVNCLLRDSTLRPIGFNFTSDADTFLVFQDIDQNDETLSCDEDDLSSASNAPPSGQPPTSNRNSLGSNRSSRPPNRDGQPGFDNQGITLNCYESL